MDNRAASAQPWADDEIDLRELIALLWSGKWLIAALGFGFAFVGIAYALYLPNIYKAETLLVEQGGDTGGGLPGQLGGLASLAGISLGGGSSSKKAIAIETVKSRVFLSDFINRHQLKPALFALKRWHESSDTLVWDNDVFTPETGKWNWDDKPEPPSDLEAVEAFRELLSVSEDKNTGFVKVSIESLSPAFAQQWVELLVEDLNSYMKQRDMAETRKNLDYLNAQLDKTPIAGMQQVFYSLIEEQTKSLMLAEVQDQYVFRVIDPPVVPEEKAKPVRALIVLLAGVLGGMLGIGIILIRQAFRSGVLPKEDGS